MPLSCIPDKHREAAKVAMLASCGAGPLGALTSVGDIAAIAGIWGACLYTVADTEGCKLDKDTAVSICKSALLGIGGYYAGCKAATKLFWLIPGAGILIGMGVSSVANVLFTYRFLLTLCNVFTEKRDGIDIRRLGDNIKSTFYGNGVWSDGADIIDILING